MVDVCWVSRGIVIFINVTYNVFNIGIIIHLPSN